MERLKFNNTRFFRLPLAAGLKEVCNRVQAMMLNVCSYRVIIIAVGLADLNVSEFLFGQMCDNLVEVLRRDNKLATLVFSAILDNESFSDQVRDQVRQRNRLLFTKTSEYANCKLFNGNDHC